ncbi:MAG: zinc ABC transporter substrate-binding protein [Brevibacterium sp.]|uniref:metal ABC transporter solute-binding protein, Zn/Mn family n=1 Tax=Brevibacterium sp. TaxID=1701 RepID=UPI0026493DE6|nr:zinc ABC transporter substrate-binding protein [Brevibacterium sp.]MDN5833227.1 zinc ABC transporter substrate-binding protein [Brevibacterium sp.]MDN5875849.1 zinc ABC transporter substrate-binding protein [Brevibacterium sp.]MDN5908188.1 zinc ABC transporter substrate-binding protein [Brevibacterium sp.]MDN6122266.1 zinc ABC transporter substrate-binding protein [Brevibacterium sp.]MDN6132832.1 zinc ABC transporter substrate-binding protein [Brevibacterium sp.]
MKTSRFSIVSGTFAITTAIALSGCGGENSDSDESALNVVTSTNVYADIISQIAGDDAEVTPVIDDPNQDPHSYEATSQDRLKLSKADLVVENGGGYDAFMTTMLEASDADPELLDVVSISGLPGSDDLGNEPHDHGDDEGDEHDHGDDEDGHDHEDEGHDHGEFNEHVWYSVPTMTKLVDEAATHLGEAVPEHQEEFIANADEYKKTLGELRSQIDEVKKDHNGEKVAATEPVPLWLFEDMGLENITSNEFLEAVEEGNDVPPLVLKKAEKQISDGEAVLLGYNTQAAGPQAEKLKSVAEKSDVPVIDLAETMPADTNYADWMGEYITTISTSLEGHKH